MLEDVSVVESVSSMAYKHRRMQNKLIHDVVSASLFVKRFTIYNRLFFLVVDSLAISYKEQTHVDDNGYTRVIFFKINKRLVFYSPKNYRLIL
jgi:hypothetical protein